MDSRSYAALVVTFLVCGTGCDGRVESNPVTPDLTVMPGHGLAQASGGGKYVLTLGEDDLPGGFSFAANRLPNGKTTGQLRYTIDFFGEHIEFHGKVTCLTVDRDEGRAWIGGVVTRNRSEAEPFASGEIFQAGRDIWFRVLDNGEGGGAVDRTTFVGFEGGAGIITSQEYCDLAIWPEDDARTWPVTAGNVQVR